MNDEIVLVRPTGALCGKKGSVYMHTLCGERIAFGCGQLQSVGLLGHGAQQSLGVAKESSHAN